MQKSSYQFDYPIECLPLFSITTPYIASPGEVILPEGDITKLHVHESLELGYCLTGSGLFLTEGRLQLLRPGDVILVYPGQVHYSRSLEGEKCVCKFIYCNVQYALCASGITISAPNEQMASVTALCGVIGQAEMEENSLIKQIITEVYRGSSITLAGAYLYVLMLKIAQRTSENECDGDNSGLIFRNRLWKILPALRAISLSYSKPISISLLARSCCLSVAQFGRLFSACTGKSPYRYLSDFRVEMAARLLECTEETVTNVAILVGYASQSDFYRNFTRLLGCAPSVYRKVKQEAIVRHSVDK